MLLFNDPAVAAKYTSEFNSDPVVHIPAGKDRNGFKGKLSTITLEAADKAFAQKSNVVKLKEVTAPPKAIAKPGETVKTI